MDTKFLDSYNTSKKKKKLRLLIPYTSIIYVSMQLRKEAYIVGIINVKNISVYHIFTKKE